MPNSSDPHPGSDDVSRFGTGCSEGDSEGNSKGCSRCTDSDVMADMRRWLERAVIGLNLCPFAKAVHVRGQIHHAVSRAANTADLLEDLRTELIPLQTLDATVRDTTLLVAPNCLHDFLEFNEFLVRANQVLKRLGMQGTVQIAPFHPQFQFAGTQADDIANFTNRAPYPTLHLLREDSVERAVAAFPQAEDIFEKNIHTLTQLGLAGWAALDVGPRGNIGP